MAAGDVVADIITVAASSSETIAPSTSTEEWLIVNLFVDPGTTGLELYFTDGTIDVKIIDLTDSLLKFNFYLTSTHYLKIVNSDSTNHAVGYNGVVTKA